MRQAGPKIFLDMTVGINRTLPFERAHEIVSVVERRIAAILPNADAVIHAEPLEMPSETLVQKIQMLVSSEGMFPHHITTHFSNGRILVSLHIEYPPEYDFEKAHTTSEILEKIIKQRLPEVSDVYIHLEEQSKPIQSTDITFRSSSIAQKVQEIASIEYSDLSCKNIRVFEFENNKQGIILDCKFQTSLPLEAVHSVVSRIENNIVYQIPNVITALIHAEPPTQTRVY